jgi:hypothetical protein
MCRENNASGNVKQSDGTQQILLVSNSWISLEILWLARMDLFEGSDAELGSCASPAFDSFH